MKTTFSVEVGKKRVRIYGENKTKPKRKSSQQITEMNTKNVTSQLVFFFCLLFSHVAFDFHLMYFGLNMKVK